MFNPESQQLTEKSLKANFTEVQQVHFDKLMSELETISGGLGFAELKVKAEAGSKEALQVMRDYIAKKEQIVEFVETKDIPSENEFVEITEMKKGDEVFVVNENSAIKYKRGIIMNFDDRGTPIVKMEDTGKTRPVFLDKLIKNAGESISKYGGRQTDLELPLLELHEFETVDGDTFRVGDEFQDKFTAGKYRLIAFAVDEGVVNALFETVGVVDKDTGKYNWSYDEPTSFASSYNKIEK